MHKFLILLFFISVFRSSITGAEFSQQRFWTGLQNYPRHYVDCLLTALQPAEHPRLYLAAAMGLPLSFFLDEPIRDWVQDTGFYGPDLSRVGDLYGHRWGYYGAVGSVVLTGILQRKSGCEITADALLITESTLTASGLTEILKRLTKRRRPNGQDHKSFPSGHTSGAFALATALTEIYGKGVGRVAWGLAALVGTSRIRDDKHYFSDVCAGACLGILVGKGFTSKRYPDWRVTFNPHTEGISIHISIR